MLDCIDMDGQGNGYDLPLMPAVARAVTIPVIASSGTGNQGHFVEVLKQTRVQAALSADMFHRKEFKIESCKSPMCNAGILARK